MSREEEIKKAAQEHDCQALRWPAFVEGAQWADANPINKKTPNISAQGLATGKAPALFLARTLGKNTELDREAQAHINTAGTLQGIIESLEDKLARAEKALLHAQATLTVIQDCMLDNKYEKYGAEGMLMALITRANLALAKIKEIKGET